MNVALLISGELRSFEHTWESMEKNIVSPLKADVFMHTWEKPSYMPRYKNAPAFTKVTPLEFIEDKVNPKSYVIDDYENTESWFHENRKIHRNEIPMFFGIYNTYRQMVNVDKKYDVVIRSRPDNLFFGEINPACLYNSLEDKTLIYTEGITEESHICLEGNREWCNSGLPHIPDMFAFGSCDAMGVYSDTYVELNNLYETLNGYRFRAEELLGYWLHIKNDMKIKRSFTQFTFLNQWDNNVMRNHDSNCNT